MKLFYLAALAAVVLIQCTPDDSFITDPFEVGAHVRNQIDGTTLRVISNDNEYSFTAVIVDAVNPQSLCDTVGGAKSDWMPCPSCPDNCK